MKRPRKLMKAIRGCLGAPWERPAGLSGSVCDRVADRFEAARLWLRMSGHGRLATGDAANRPLGGTATPHSARKFPTCRQLGIRWAREDCLYLRVLSAGGQRRFSLGLVLDGSASAGIYVAHDVTYTTKLTMMMPISVIWYCWGLLALAWLFGATHTKPTLRSTDLRVRMASIGTTLLGFFLLVSDWGPSWLGARPLLAGRALQFTAMTLTFVGCSFAIWARLALGRNWSGRPTLKAGHGLVVSGPYTLSRHPIYTGILVAAVGTALADLQWRRVLGAVMLTLAF